MAPSIDGITPSTANLVTDAERLCQIITPVGCLGFGFIDAQIEAELERSKTLPAPTAIILDAGSTDSGPQRLALGLTAAPRSSYVRDLSKLLSFVVKYKVPLVVSSSGGDGSDEHVDLMVEIIRELAELPENKAWKLKVLAIYSSVSAQRVTHRFNAGGIVGCGPAVPDLTQSDIDKASRIVAQVGPEPFLDAMNANPDFNVIIGGRAYDPAPYIAYCAFNALKGKSGDLHSLPGEVLGSFGHMGKIMECGGQCATPKSIAAVAEIYKDATFSVTPLDPVAKCLPLSVASHCLYEKTRADILHGPGGFWNFTKTNYEQLSDGRSVRVRGAVFESHRNHGEKYNVKLEGAKVSGYRAIFIGSWCDPTLVTQVDSVLQAIKTYVAYQHSHVEEYWDLDFHVYGANEKWDPSQGGRPYYGNRGVFIVGEAIAATQKLATSIASVAKLGATHAPYKGQKATSGNLGFGIGGKMEMETEECVEFCVYHLMPLEAGEEGAFHASSHEAGMAETEDGKPLFHWTETLIGKGEPAGEGVNGFQAAKPVKKVNYKLTAFEPQIIKDNPRTLGDIAPVVRSKNAGPYEITIDVLFPTKAVYDLVAASGILDREIFSRLYNLQPEEVIYCNFFEQALAFKATFPRKRNGKLTPSGGFLETDMHGSQQYLPLLELQLPENLIHLLNALPAEEKVQGS